MSVLKSIWLVSGHIPSHPGHPGHEMYSIQFNSDNTNLTALETKILKMYVRDKQSQI